MTAAAFDRRVTLARPDLAAEHLRGRIEAPRYAVGVPHTVTLPVAPLRRDPHPACGLDTEVLHGETFTVYDVNDEGWAWGQVDVDGYVGWLPPASLAPATTAGVTHKVVSLRTFVYPLPSIKAPVRAALPFGARIEASGVDGAFVETGQGYVWAGHCAVLSHVAKDFVTVAEALLGVPYLWGGRSSAGLDCSGLVQTALSACGLRAPRDSDMQEVALGVPIDPDGPLKRGDLVFWRGHVGLMRDPEMLLHANGQTMTVATEELAAARTRIANAGGGDVITVRRLDHAPARADGSPPAQ